MLIVEIHLLAQGTLRKSGYDSYKINRMLDHVFLDVCGAEKIADGQDSSVDDFHDFVPLMTAACLLAEKKEHCHDTDEWKGIFTDMKELMEAQEALDKNTAPMEWVGYMNNLKHQAEEMMYPEVIYR